MSHHGTYNSNHIYKLLTEHGTNPTISGKDYVIRCLNPEHEDNNPSLRVDQTTGAYHCLSCGFKGNILAYYGVFTRNNSIAAENLKNKLNKVKSQATGLDFPKGSEPYYKSFRNISKKTIGKFECFYTNEVEELKDRIIIPIKDISDKIRYFIGRHLHSNIGKKYVVYPRHVSIIPTPQILPPSTRSIILVEGIFDMMRLHDNGILNAVCVFGTSTLSKNAQNLLQVYKVQGVQKVYVLFDGDSAGRKAANQLEHILPKIGFKVEILELDDGEDPCSLTEEKIQIIKNYVS